MRNHVLKWYLELVRVICKHMGNIFMSTGKKRCYPRNIIDLRYNIATNYLNKLERVSRLCQIYNTTRKTILKWAKRFIEKGKRGLEDLSKRPKRVWNKKPKKLEEKVCSLFRQGYSPEEIYLKLRDKLCERTVYNILERNRLPRKKKKRKYKRYEYKEPNQLWHTDFTEFRIRGYGKFYIVAVRTLKKPLKKKWFNNPEEFIKEVNEFVDRYNNKPKRVLNWKTPREGYI